MKAACLLLTLLLLLPELVVAQQSTTEHTVGASLHLRTAFTGDSPAATAHSFRATMNWKAAWSDSWITQLQANAIAADSSHYFDGVTDNGFAKIPDAEGLNLTEANILYIRPGNELILGRQSLQLLKGRLVGNNGFWQKPQVFDALRLERAFGGQIEISGSYIWQAHRIGGSRANNNLQRDDIRFEQLQGKRPVAELGKHSLNSWMLEGTFRHSRNTAKLIALNHDNQSLDDHDNVIAGLTFNHIAKLRQWRLSATVTGLSQKRLDQTIPYYDLQVAISRPRFGVTLQRETLGTKEGVAFITPLASLHDFQGMSDQFLATPSSGLHDNNLAVAFRSKTFGKVTTKAHYFERYSGQTLGHELSVEWDKTFDMQLALNLRAAQFTGRDELETWKVFVTIEQKFGQM